MFFLCGFVAVIPAIGTAIQQAVVITSLIARLFTGYIEDWGFVIASGKKTFAIGDLSGALNIRLGSDTGNDKCAVQDPVNPSNQTANAGIDTEVLKDTHDTHTATYYAGKKKRQNIPERETRLLFFCFGRDHFTAVVRKGLLGIANYSLWKHMGKGIILACGPKNLHWSSTKGKNDEKQR